MHSARMSHLVLAVLFVSGTACRQQTGEPSEALLRMKAQCRQAGAESRARWVKKYPGETFSNEPEYAYSERFHTCLYADSYSDSGGPFFPGVPREDRFVEDIFANRVILELTLHSGAPIPAAAGDTSVNCKSEKEFVARKAELFTANASDSLRR
jgi:hypothetical protein